MAARPVELEYVAAVWNLAANRDERVAVYAQHVPPAALQQLDLHLAYKYILERWARGQPLHDAEAVNGLQNILMGEFTHLQDTAWEWQGYAHQEQNPRSYAKRVTRHWATRRRAAALQALAEKAAAAVDDEGKRSREVGDQAVAEMLTLEAGLGERRAQSRDEITDQEKKLVRAGVTLGRPWPYKVFNRMFGRALPGKLIGMTGYPGTGKTQLVTNIVRGFVTAEQPTPVITASTEMEVDFQRRIWAEHGGLHQRLVEHMAWDTASEAEKERYEATLEDMRGCPWEMILDEGLTLDGFMARVRILRRRYPGQHVVWVLDNYFALEFGGQEPEKTVGRDTQRLRKFCQQDRDGGMTGIIVFQPRKPPAEDDIFNPVRAHQVKGSQIWGHVDIHFSPYRRAVATMSTVMTPWGSPSCQYGEDGWPVRVKRDEPGAKLDDEHVYIFPDKIRTGGEGPAIRLRMDAPTGLIYEECAHFDGDPFILETYSRHRDYAHHSR